MPAVASPTRLDIYRDGGSLSASFLDRDGIEHTLFFPVRLVARGAQRFERVGYFPPRLERLTGISRASPVTGLQSIDTRMESEAISWQEARRILSELAPLMPQFDSEYSHVFPMMQEAADGNGGIGESA